MNTLILNRNNELPADKWHQIEVTGEHPAGKDRVQVIDAVALTSIVEQWHRNPPAGGMLVDADHLSHDMDKSTEAYGWVQDLRVQDGELEARIEWTDIGTPAIQNKRFKFFSTEYSALDQLSNGRIRPTALAGLALTNRPNNKGGRPITNRDGESENHEIKSNESMKTIAEKLGLAPEATEEEILAAITGLNDRVSELEGKESEVEAEEILNRHSAKIPAAQRDNWKNQLLTNREATEQLLDGLTAPAAPKKPNTTSMKNRAEPPAPVGGEATKEDKGAEQKSLVQKIQTQNKCSHGEAWRLAKQEKPELFAA